MIELLVVMAVIVVLMGMMMPVLGIMRRFARTTATQAVMKKVDTGLRLFATDHICLPGQMSYPDLSSGGAIDNRLFYHIGTDLEDVQRDRILADAESGAQKFNYNATAGSEGAQPSPVTFTFGLIVNEPRATWNDTYRRSYAALANRMAREQVRLAAVSGNLWMMGQVVTRNSTGSTLIVDKSATPIFDLPAQSEAGPGPGWATDYLAGDLEPRYRQDLAILDAWKRPLVYVSQNIPAVSGTSTMHWNHTVSIRDNRRYGLGAIGFDPRTGPGPDVKATRPHLLYGGRIPLTVDDAGDGQPTPTHATFFPDATNLRGADMRFYAAPGFVRDFELWSMGPDGRFDWMRDAAVNRDNVSVQQYERDL